MATLRIDIPLTRLTKFSPDQEGAIYFGKRLPVAVAQEEFFVQMVTLEQKRAERSRRPAILMLIEREHELCGPLFYRVANAIFSCTRETDILGWYKQDVTLGLLITEITSTDTATVALLSRKIVSAIQQSVDAETSNHINLIFRIYPQASTENSTVDSVTLLPAMS
jgi:hypothetical protein